MRDFLALLAALVVVCAPPADALTLLPKAKVAFIRNDPSRGPPSAFIRAGENRDLKTLFDPTCPATSSLEIASNKQTTGRIALPCTNWQAVLGGFRYSDPGGRSGPVHSILYHHTRLVIRARGKDMPALTGPVGYLSTWLNVGGERLLIRFHEFRRNDTYIVAQKTRGIAGVGEQAFWDTLWGDAEREDETIRLLETAVTRNPVDGYSWFLLGMMHLYRFGQGGGFQNADDVAKSEEDAASQALDMAVPLLPTDTRIQGFRAAATYMKGVVHQDAALVATGLQQLNDAVAANVIFNSFDFFSVVPQTVPPTSPLVAQAVGLVDGDVTPPKVSCVQDLPEVCANAGMAPHNTEGALLLFGDVYAKGGRLADAQAFYGLSNVLAANWPFHALALDRVATAAQRVAAYRDGDPGNDPRIVGTGVEACSYCHRK